MFDIHRYDTVDSTQEIAKKLVENGALEHTAVVAYEQKRGRGRLERSWISPAGGLYISLVLKEHDLLPVLVAVAVAKALRNMGIQATIKWPNDILVSGKKIAGILIELDLGYGIVGIGLNITETPLASATSIMAIGEQNVTRDTVMNAILDQIVLLENEGDDRLLWHFWNLSDTLGRTVRIERLHDSVEGVAVNFDARGALIIETEDAMTTVTYGDCIHLE